MPFLAKESPQLPEKDITSWYFDEPTFDQDKPIYLDALNTSRYYTANQAKTAIRQLVAGFRNAGLQRGDCVGLHSFNNLHYPILANGIVAFGGVFAGTNPSYTKYELVHHIKTSKARLLIVEPELLAGAVEAATETGIPHSRILILDDDGQAIPPGFQSWRSLLSHGEQDWVRLTGAEAKTTTASRLFSSGTTGLPKAAILTHFNFVAQNHLTQDGQRRTYPQVRRLMPLPMFHAAAVPSTHFGPLHTGFQIFIMRRFELDSFLEHLEKLKITDLAVVPPMVLAIIMSPASKKYDLTSIQFANVGAAPLDKGPQARLQALLAPGAPVTQVWGMTETSCTCCCFMLPEADDTGSVGYMLPGMDVKLVDDAGKDITNYDVRGEICVRGPLVITGYFENPEANARDWDSEGYFHTGDIGYCAKGSGKWYIVDRKKELIKVRGFQVAPPELEAVLLAHPAIVDAAVIGIRGTGAAAGSEFPCAYVVRRPGPEGAALTEQDVYDTVKRTLARYKWLEGGVRFVDAIPKNPSGKILKRVLREEAEREAGRKVAAPRL